MIVKSKKHKDGKILRMLSGGKIREVIINEDIMNPSKENIAICFRGNISSGIVELSSEEVDMIVNKVASKTHLIKEMKVFTDPIDNMIGTKPKKPKKKSK